MEKPGKKNAAYVNYFRNAYNELCELYCTKNSLAFVENGFETDTFHKYALAIHETVRCQLLSSKNGNASMTEKLLKSFDLVLFDDLITEVTNKILLNETQKQSYLKLNDATHAFCSICMTITNTLKDMNRSLQRKNKVSFISLNSPMMTDDGDECTLGDFLADPKSDFEDNAIKLLYGKTVFIHEICDLLLMKDTPHYMLAYLYNVAGKSSGDLYDDLQNSSWNTALKNIVVDLSDIGINLHYLTNTPILWKTSERDIPKNQPYIWKSQVLKYAAKQYKLLSTVR